MEIDKTIKKKVIEDWQKAFPQLTLYSQNKLYKVLGPLIIGIELIKLPRTEEYRPHFVIYSLWGSKMGKDLKACLSGPIILKEFFNRKGLQFSIPYVKHSSEFLEVLNAVKKQLPFSMENDVSIEKVFLAIEEYSKTPPHDAAPNSYLQANLQECQLELALTISEEKHVQKILTQIRKKKWDINSFNMWNVDLDKWLMDLQEKVNNRDEFLDRIKVNKQDKKLFKLKKSNLIA